MSEPFVADSSVGVAWVMPTQANPETDQLLENFAEGASLVVPTLWPLEVANALLVLLRRKKILLAEHIKALTILAHLPFVMDDEGARLAFNKLSAIAAEHGLSIYNASYLELAIRRKLPLASRDQALCKAARACRVKLVF